MIWVRRVSDFCGRVLATIIALVTFLPANTFFLGINNIVFVFYGTLVPYPYDIPPISFSNKFSFMALVGLLI